MGLIDEFLAQHPYFRDLDAARREGIAQRMAPQRLSRGEILALEGDVCPSVYFVIEGRIRALKMSPEGREQVVSEIGPQGAFYIVPALDGGPAPVTTQAATRATLLRVDCASFVELLERHPHLSMHVLQDFAQRLRRLSQLVEDLSLRSVSGRLARLLVERAASPGGHRMTQREMAAQLGTVREVVSRTLGEFEEQGWIVVHRGRIEILDPDALREMTWI